MLNSIAIKFNFFYQRFKLHKANCSLGWEEFRITLPVLAKCYHFKGKNYYRYVTDQKLADLKHQQRPEKNFFKEHFTFLVSIFRHRIRTT